MDECVFCNEKWQKKKKVVENKHFLGVFDINPVSDGHMIIIPRRHIESFFKLSEEEVIALLDILKKARDVLDKKHHPEGYNIGMNDGSAAGQTIFHLHIHMIPRYKGDVADPAGGVRNLICGKTIFRG